MPIRRKKPEAATSGYDAELPQIPGSSNTRLLSYYIIRVVARPEICPFCYYVPIDAGGAICFSVSAGVVGGARLTVAINAAWLQNENSIARRKEDIVRLKKAKKPTVWRKTAADIA